MQEFCPRSNMLKVNFFKTILQWIMVRQKLPKLYLQSQFSIAKIAGIKKNKNKNTELGDRFLWKNSFDFWR